MERRELLRPACRLCRQLTGACRTTLRVKHGAFKVPDCRKIEPADQQHDAGRWQGRGGRRFQRRVHLRQLGTALPPRGTVHAGVAARPPPPRLTQRETHTIPPLSAPIASRVPLTPHSELNVSSGLLAFLLFNPSQKKPSPVFPVPLQLCAAVLRE